MDKQKQKKKQNKKIERIQTQIVRTRTKKQSQQTRTPNKKPANNACNIQQVLAPYIQQYFNPKQIPSLICQLMQYFMDVRKQEHKQKQGVCGQEGVLNMIKRIWHSSDTSLLLANMKMYDGQQIHRQNRFIQQFYQVDKTVPEQQHTDSFDKQTIGGNNAYLGPQVVFSPYNHVLIGKNMKQQGIKQIYNRTQAQTHDNTHKLSNNYTQIQIERNVTHVNNDDKSGGKSLKSQVILQFLMMSYKVFNILQYRLKDLASFITTINRITNKYRTTQDMGQQQTSKSKERHKQRNDVKTNELKTKAKLGKSKCKVNPNLNLHNINDLHSNQNEIDSHKIEINGQTNQIRYIEAIIFTLQQLSTCLLRHINNIKTKYQQYVQMLVNQNIFQDKQNLQYPNNCKSRKQKEKTNKDKGGCFGQKRYAKQLEYKLKQIKQKYTKISKQIIKRQNQYKSYRTYIGKKPNEVFKIKVNLAKNAKNTKSRKNVVNFNVLQPFSETQTQNQINLLSVPTFSDANTDSYNQFQANNPSVLKKFQRSNKKRISIQMITQLIQLQKAQKSEKLGKRNQTEKQSRFAPRSGINLGSGDLLFDRCNELSMNTKKKYVKILNADNQKPQKFNETFNSCRNLRRNSKLNSSRRSNLGFQLQFKLSNCSYQDRYKERIKFQRKSLTELRKKRFLSFTFLGQKSRQNQLASSKNIDKLKRNKTKSGIFKFTNTQKKKLQPSKKKIRASHLRKYTEVQQIQNSSNSSSNDSYKNQKSMRIINTKNDPQLTQSMKLILILAMQNKKQNKYGYRSGRVVTSQFSSSLLQEKEKDNNKERLDMVYKNVINKNKEKMLRKPTGRQQKKSQQITLSQQKRQINQIKKSARKAYKIQDRIKQPKTLRRNGQSNLIIFQRFKTQTNQKILKEDIKNQLSTLVGGGEKSQYIRRSRIDLTTNQYNQGPSVNKRCKVQTEQSQSYKISQQCKVNFEDRLTFVNENVKFYPNIQCSLYKTTKQNMKKMQIQNFQTKAQMKLLHQFGQIPNLYVKKYVQHNISELQQKQAENKKRIFNLEGQRIKFTKRFMTSINQLQQTQMKQYCLNNSTSRPNLVRKHLFQQNFDDPYLYSR